ncbi:MULTISPECIES: response regulator transcription factor [Subtercola]|uniref:Response regulator n=1 Tax=Subtercola vilae TaxID=2056433 RepID=A0A4T2C3N8_9MICO|nr:MULTISPECIES: response regulator [Subtercola]MEA9984801.1 response regulator [Subtercola sp. RTI3]TIH38973.1 response regulator [Subtercola vilae]
MAEQLGLVMIVEDDKAIADVERLYLTQAGFGVHTESNGERALEEIRRRRPVAVVLDVGLPGLDGISVCRRLREAGDWVPVIFVTARDDEVDRLLGLELGADDYLTKPFSPRELVTRIRGILRRTNGVLASTVRRVGTIELDERERSVRASGRPVELTAMEFDLLAYLSASAGQVFTRDQLLAAVWGQANYSGARTVDVHVAQLRSKLGADSPLRTWRGVGYSVVGAAVGAST